MQAAVNPLESYIVTAYLYDPWGRKLHYEGVKGNTGEVINYRLESLGWFASDPGDNIPCPVDPQDHGFSAAQ